MRVTSCNIFTRDYLSVLQSSSGLQMKYIIPRGGRLELLRHALLYSLDLSHSGLNILPKSIYNNYIKIKHQV